MLDLGTYDLFWPHWAFAALDRIGIYARSEVHSLALAPELLFDVVFGRPTLTLYI